MDYSDTRTTTCPSALDDSDAELESDMELLDATLSESPPASTAQSAQNESSGPATDERSQYTFNSDVSGDEASAMTLCTDRINQGDPEPIATRKEVMPVRLPPAYTHHTVGTNRDAH